MCSNEVNITRTTLIRIRDVNKQSIFSLPSDLAVAKYYASDSAPVLPSNLCVVQIYILDSGLVLILSSSLIHTFSKTVSNLDPCLRLAVLTH
jgi:hypothetical protein